MSEFHVVVARVTNIERHPNADTLSIAKVNGYPVIFKTGDFLEGDLAGYIPIDSVCPENVPEFEFLGTHRRIKAKKLRGIFSMGFIIPCRPGWIEGQDIQLELGITKWEPKLSFSDPLSQYTEKRKKKFWLKRWWEKFLYNYFGIIPRYSTFDPGYVPEYTDIEGMRKYDDILTEDEEVVITEKIHGTNARFLYRDDRLWIGTHHGIRHDKCAWSIIAEKYNLKQLLSEYPRFTFFGEIYGDVQDLKYGCKQGELKLAIFDIYFDTGLEEGYFDWNAVERLCKKLNLPTVPVLYRGPWNKELKKFADGNTTIEGANHIREGIVVRPTLERWDPHIGRVILKLLGEKYLLRKGA